MTSRPRRDFVCFSITDWWYHNRAHSDFQLTIRLSEYGRVLFVNSIGMRMPIPGRTDRYGRRLLRKARSIRRYLRRPSQGLQGFHVLSPVSLPLYGSPALRRANAAIVAKQVRWAERYASLRDPAYIITVPTAWDVVEQLEPSLLIYNRSDKHSAFPGVNREFIRTRELALLTNADSVLYVCPELLEEERPLVRERGHLIDHGVDLAMFRPDLPEPTELARLPRPRIGFIGGLRAETVDMRLLERVADEVSEALLVLVGDAPSSIDRLVNRPNVHWIPQKDYSEIPAFTAALDVGLMPYVQSEWVRSCNPIKLKEYLASGIRVVSTDFPVARAYEPHVRVARNPSEFIDLVRSSLHSPLSSLEQEAQRARVDGKTWSSLAQDLLELCTRSSRSAEPSPHTAARTSAQ